jgi:uncharacterized protein YndB with AHSA1/START domain
MGLAKVVEWVDIQAPRAEVFKLIVDIERRMQLSPLWGIANIEAKSSNYPDRGSKYIVRYQAGNPTAYQTVITDYESNRKLSYRLDVDQQTNVTWLLNDTPRGTRVVYMEEYLVEDENAEQFNRSVRDIVKSWLTNIQRYAELRQSAFKRFIRWLADRFYLRLRPEQRRVIVMILVMQFVSFIAFIMAALAIGMASLFL